MRSRVKQVELAVLGILEKESLHGYELRKRILRICGPSIGLSFSTLYPQLRRMVEAGLVSHESVAKTARSKRARVIYSITDIGRMEFSEIAQAPSEDALDDEEFQIRVAFFSSTPKKNRVRILEERLFELRKKRHAIQQSLDNSEESIDRYLQEWNRHLLERAENEIDWLRKSIKREGLVI